MDHNQLLTPPKTIAIIGLSDNPDRPSYGVAKYLLNNGFTIIPVNPTVTEVLGQKSYPNFSDIPKDIQIDIVDIFRKPEFVLDIVKEIIQTGRKPFIWMQEGVIVPEAKQLAIDNNLEVEMDRCIAKTHLAIKNSK